MATKKIIVTNRLIDKTIYGLINIKQPLLVAAIFWTIIQSKNINKNNQEAGGIDYFEGVCAALQQWLAWIFFS